MRKYRLGLRPFVHTLKSARRMAIFARHIGALGAPPANSTPWGEMAERATGQTDWLGMLGNGPDPNNPPDEPGGVGDCVICDDARQLMLWTALGKGPVVEATTAQALSEYAAIAGFNPADPNSDQGTDPTANAEYLKKIGFLGHRIADYVVADPANADHLKWAMQIFGGVKFCINLPDFAEDLFDAGKPWDYDGRPYQTEGGHDILGVQYTTDGSGAVVWDVVTWGRRIQMTERFAREFLATAIPVCSADFIRRNGTAPNGLDLTAMLADLAAVK